MILKWLVRIFLIFLFVVLALFLLAAALPVPVDPELPREQWGVGASSVEPSFSGLQRAFPPTNEPAENPTTAEKVALGRLLFFDPVLSTGNDIACATCHHPDYGFADGLPLAIGRGGAGVGPERQGDVVLARNTPSLWNVAYRRHLFWDGRETSLEEQVLVPLTHADEMGAADTEELVSELEAIDAYGEHFANAFGDETVTLERVQQALAAFQRSLITVDLSFRRNPLLRVPRGAYL